MKKIIFVVLAIVSFFFTTTNTTLAEEKVARSIVTLSDSVAHFDVPNTVLQIGLANEEKDRCGLGFFLYKMNPTGKIVEEYLSTLSTIVAEGGLTIIEIAGKRIKVICNKGQLVADSPFPLTN